MVKNTKFYSIVTILILSSFFSINCLFDKKFISIGQTEDVPVKDFSGGVAIDWINEYEGVVLTSDGRVIKTTDGGIHWYKTNDLSTHFPSTSHSFIEMIMEDFENGLFFTNQFSVDKRFKVVYLKDNIISILPFNLPQSILNSPFYLNLSSRGVEPDILKLDYVGKISEKYYIRLILSKPGFFPNFRVESRSLILSAIISFDIDQLEAESIVLKEGNFSYNINDSWPIGTTLKYNSTHILSNLNPGSLSFISTDNKITNKTILDNQSVNVEGLTFINETHGWIATREYLYKTLDGGDNWLLVSDKHLMFDIGINKDFSVDEIYYKDLNNCYIIVKEEIMLDHQLIVRNHILISTNGGARFHTGIWPIIYQYKNISFYDVNDLSFHRDSSLWGVDSRLEVLLFTNNDGNTWNMYPEVKWGSTDESAFFIVLIQIFLFGGTVLMIFSSIPEIVGILLEKSIFKRKNNK